MRYLLIGLLALLPLLAAAATDPAETLARLQLAASDLDAELQQIETDISRDRSELIKAETMPAGKITPRLLEDVRLELAALRSRESGLKTRLQARENLLKSLDERINALGLETGTETSTETIATELALLEQTRPVLETLTTRLQQLRERFLIRAALRRQQLNVLQARFELPELGQDRQRPSAETEALQAEVDQLLLDASSARRSLGGLSADTAANRAKRRLLETRALAAEERAEFLQLAIGRKQANRMLETLAVFRSAKSTPVRVLEQAVNNISRLQQDLSTQTVLLEQKQSQFVDQRQIVQQQGAIASGADSTLNERLALLDELITIASAEQKELTKLKEQVQQVGEEYRKNLTTNASAELLQRRELPVDRESWSLLARKVLTLPPRVAVAFSEAVQALGHRYVHSDPQLKALLILGFIGLIGGGIVAHRLIARNLTKVKSGGDSDESLAWVPLEILQRNLSTLLPPVAVLIACITLGVKDQHAILLLAPLCILPAVTISLAFINNLLDYYTPGLNPAKTKILLLETRWVIITSAVLAATLIAAYTVALSPLVLDAIDRAAMLCLLLIALPLLHLRSLLIEGVESDLESRVIRGSTLAVPLALAACALLGLTGYVNLAYAVAVRLAWLLVVFCGFHFLRNMTRAAFSMLLRWKAAHDEESAPFWQQYILGPAYRISILLLLIASGNLLFSLYGWDAETPIVSAFPALLSTELFTLGQTAIQVKTLLLAVAVLFVVIWGAGWSKQVSYRWVYTQVVDPGIRNSLSTFTQYFFVLLGLILAMKIIGLDLTALTVFAGALGVGIGFGMQQIVVNFISGILLLLERPLSTTDLVNVDKYEGEVTRIGIRSLTVKTFDNQDVIIPNSSVITKPFTNWTRGDDVMRTILMVGISYDDNPHEAVELIKRIVSAHPGVLETPGPKVLLWEYGDSALMIRVQFHSRIRGDVGRADLRSQLLFQIWDAFKEHGITIPYPQRDVHLHQSPST